MYTEQNHTFVVLAYGKSAYLENCIESLLSQRVTSHIIIATSTPNEVVGQVAKKYSLPYFINTGETGIGQDWNFGYSCAKTPLITIAHQDDIYHKAYLETALRCLNRSQEPLLFFSDYWEIRNEKKVDTNLNLRIKRMMLFPLRFRGAQHARWLRRRILSFGNPICCPAVTYVRDRLPFPLFDGSLMVSLDWDTWERLSKLNGSFLFSSDKLMGHRIYGASTTTAMIEQGKRIEEDMQILRRFWPCRIARRIESIYATSEKSNFT